jgi:hypothetical protein
MGQTNQDELIEEGSLVNYRLYYWFKGAPDDRPGGPWWYQDFMSMREATRLLTDLFPFLHQARILVATTTELPEHDPMEIYPPGAADPLFPQVMLGKEGEDLLRVALKEV